MKILSLIMARAGSKRLKNKNLKKIKKYSLVERSIEISNQLKKKKIICETLLSTDSKKILSIGKKNKIIAPWLRPKSLSQSNSTSGDVALHAIKWFEKKYFKLDALLLLQPTTPFRQYKDLVKAINLFRKYRKKVVSVSPIKSHFQDMYAITNNKLINENKNRKKKYNKKLYVCNGYLYIFPISDLRIDKNFSANNAIPFIINSNIKSIDIDDKYDFEMAVKLNEE